MRTRDVLGGDEVMRRRRRELGAFLRQRRASMAPTDLGVTSIGRRHVKGLRREEVAAAARIGVSWYTMLEQGRVAGVTTRTLDAICDVLQLTQRERTHVRGLAAGSIDELASIVAPPPQPLLDFTRAYPLGGAFVHDALFDVVAYNAWMDGLFNFSAHEQPNLLRVMLHDPDVRARLVRPSWYETLQRMVGHFRLRYATCGTSDHDALLATLRAASPEFEAIWHQRPVVDPPTETCLIEHATAGRTLVQVLALVPPAAPTHTFVLNNVVNDEHPA